jgi:hypothetical protein
MRNMSREKGAGAGEMSRLTFSMPLYRVGRDTPHKKLSCQKKLYKNIPIIIIVPPMIVEGSGIYLANNIALMVVKNGVKSI